MMRGLNYPSSSEFGSVGKFSSVRLGDLIAVKGVAALTSPKLGVTVGNFHAMIKQKRGRKKTL